MIAAIQCERVESAVPTNAAPAGSATFEAILGECEQAAQNGERLVSPEAVVSSHRDLTEIGPTCSKEPPEDKALHSDQADGESDGAMIAVVPLIVPVALDVPVIQQTATSSADNVEITASAQASAASIEASGPYVRPIDDVQATAPSKTNRLERTSTTEAPNISERTGAESIEIEKSFDVDPSDVPSDKPDKDTGRAPNSDNRSHVIVQSAERPRVPEPTPQNTPPSVGDTAQEQSSALIEGQEPERKSESTGRSSNAEPRVAARSARSSTVQVDDSERPVLGPEALATTAVTQIQNEVQSREHQPGPGGAENAFVASSQIVSQHDQIAHADGVRSAGRSETHHPSLAAAREAITPETPRLASTSTQWIRRVDGETLQLGLRTESFGRVEVSTRVQGDHVYADVRAADAAITPLLHAEIPQLGHALEAQGMQLASFSFSQSAAMDFGAGQQSGRQHPHPPSSHTYAAGSAETVSASSSDDTALQLTQRLNVHA